MKHGTVPVVLLMLALTTAVFWPIVGAGFVSLDDDRYVAANPAVAEGLRWKGIVWAFTTGHASNWHPVTWMSHMIDASLYGMAAGGHHVMNLLIHLANTALLCLVLSAFTGAAWRSAAVAALFAIHPLHVESVAWVSERKDLLSGLFLLAALAAYRRYVSFPGIGRYLPVAGAFVLGLMAKPMVVTLPILLLLLDFWPLGRVRKAGVRHLVVEKLPMMGMSIASATVTLLVQRRAMGDLATYPLGARLLNAVVSYARYLAKALVPRNLSTHYPFPEPPPPVAAALAIAAALLAATVLAARRRGRQPYLSVGWLWYAVMLLPVIGIVQVGRQAMADRYTYLPLTGVFLLAVWWVAEATAASRAGRIGAVAVLGIFLLLCAVASRTLAGKWRDDVALFAHAVEVNPDDWLSHSRLGVALAKRGRVAEAIPHLAVNPRPEEAHFNMGWAYSINGAVDLAVREYTSAVRLRPDYSEAHSNLGTMLLDRGMIPEAMEHLQEALRLSPQDAESWNSLGVCFLRLGNRADAERAFREAVRQNPFHPEARANLARLAASGR